MKLIQNPKSNLKLSYKKRLEQSYIFALILVIVTFLVFQKNTSQTKNFELLQEIPIEAICLLVPPKTKAPKPINRPKKPFTKFIASADSELLEKEEIFDEVIKIEFEEMPNFVPQIIQTPKRSYENRLKVVGYENQKLKKGLAKAVALNLDYPRSFRQAGIEGKVKIKFDVNSKGKPLNFQILNDPSEGLLAELAFEAVKKIKFQILLLEGEEFIKDVELVTTFNLR
ncbi:MAG: TonB family protein [Calditrichaeota bacterium]|nr:MAG: TonB family protein [Calditrichota bacterium]